MVTIPKYITIIALTSLAAIGIASFTLISYENAIKPIPDGLESSFTEEEIISLDLHPKIVENLVNGLIKVYDEKGLENLHNANYIGILSGGENGNRYLYIIDPQTHEILGQHDNAPPMYRILPPTLNQTGEAWANIHDGELQTDGSTIIAKHYFKMHDGLIFTSGYDVDLRGLPVL